MSNRRRANKRSYQHRGHTHNRALGPGESYLVMPALATNRHEPGIEQRLRQQTHDRLYEAARERELVTGVWWTTHYGAEALRLYRNTLAELGQAPLTEEDAAEYGVQLEGNPELLMVAAWAIGVAQP